MRACLRGLATVLLAVAVACAAPAYAVAQGPPVGVCSGTVTVQFSPPLTPLPATSAVDLSIAAATLTCSGDLSSLTLNGLTATDPGGASCTGPIAAQGDGNVLVDSSFGYSVDWVVSGTAPAQAWTLLDKGSAPPQIVAGGTATWLPSDGPGVGPCVTSLTAITSVTYTVVLVVG